MNPALQKGLYGMFCRFGSKQVRADAGDGKLIAEDALVRASGLGQKHRNNQRGGFHFEPHSDGFGKDFQRIPGGILFGCFFAFTGA